ncbi:MAG: putative Ig domain-containing protein, partial [Acidobacteriaceae bacterium]|nr:putative Ig domain-containing protein [Acidobacteriaceae bacterium]
QTLAASGGAGGTTWSISAGALPAGLTLNSNRIEGTPSSAGSFNFMLKAADSAGTSATQALSISIANAPVVITNQQVPNGTVGVSYSAILAASGGTGTYTWTVTTGALPPGLNLVSGQISGSPSAAGSYSFTIRAADTANASATQSLAIMIFAGLTISGCSAGPVTAGQSYSASLNATGGAPPYQWAIAGGQLPAGLNLSSSGQISGTPSQSGDSSFAVKVTDSNQVSALQNCSLLVYASLSINSGTSFTAAQGTAFSQALSATGGQPPYTWSVGSGSLPPGVSLAAAGQFQGAPTTAGSYSFQVTVADKNGSTASQSITVQVIASLAIAACPSASAQLNQPYSGALSAAGGQPPYSWSVAGQLPPGLTLDSSGNLGGSASQAGVFSFSIAVKDSGSQTANKSCSIGVSENLSIATDSLGSSVAGVAYSQQISAVGGTPPYSFAAAGGALPPGVNINGSGQVSGTPSTPGNFSFTVKASDAAGASTTKAFTVQVSAQVTIGSCPASSVIAGQPYSGTFTASGGQPPYTFSLISGVLPSGIRLNATTGAVSGSSSAIGNYNYSVQVADKSSSTATAACSLNVLSALSIITVGISDATVQSPFVQVLQASGGQPPYNWTVTAGSLPPGLTLSSTGVIAGTPTQTGTFTFTVGITDAGGSVQQRQFTLNVAGGVIIPACPLGTAEVGFAYASSLSGAGGNAPYTFGVNGPLPAGLSFNGQSNSITGTPTQSGSFPFALTLTDKSSASASRNCTLDVRTGLKIVTGSLSGASTGGPYVSTLAASGGVPPYSWATTGGALPPGLFLNAGTGQVSGTPTIPGQFSVTIQLADSLGAQTTNDFTIVVGQGLVISDCPTPAAMLGQPYSAALVVGGGTAPYTWSISQGVLPTGLALQSSAAMIAGTPAQAGIFPYSLTATDSNSRTATRSCSIQITSADLIVTSSASLTTALVGQQYTQSLTASGGNAPYSWSLVNGSLPSGLTLDSSGTLSGSPTAEGAFQFSLQVTDQSGLSSTQTFTLTVQAAASPAVSVNGLPDIVGPAQQPTLSLQLNSGYPAPISGTVTLTFVPDPSVGVDDPSIQFATGGRTLNFTVAPNSTAIAFAAPIAALQTGTVAGTIQLTISLQSNGVDITPSPAPQRSIRVDRVAPAITSSAKVQTAQGFQINLVGYSTTREVTQGTFHFVFSNGGTQDVTVPMSDAAKAWFGSTASAPYGGQFSLSQP